MGVNVFMFFHVTYSEVIYPFTYFLVCFLDLTILFQQALMQILETYGIQFCFIHIDKRGQNQTLLKISF